MPNPQNLAGKFQPYVPPGFNEHARRILYVGKATKGEFDEPNANESAFNGDTPFWRFARSISELADPACKDLSNVAWSNLFKQGVTVGNPEGRTAEAQRDEAATLLRHEALTLNPTLIVLVNADYYEEVPRAAFDIPDDTSENALIETQVPGELKFHLWHRPALGPFPLIVWMFHPQRKRSTYTTAALDLIARLTNWP